MQATDVKTGLTAGHRIIAGMAFALFEENGDLKSGTVLADNGSSLQVELVTGRRAKVKASHVYLRFDSPAAEVLLPEALTTAEEIDLDFLWECAPEDEFDFGSLAGEYFGGQPDAVQSTALLTKLKSAPIYFQRKGRGRFKAAPSETIQAALAGVKKRQEQEARIQELADDMVAGNLPDSIRDSAAQLISRPDKMSLEFKALDKAMSASSKPAQRLLFDLGAFESDHGMHLSVFESEQFGRGIEFAPALANWKPPAELTARIAALPLADVVAFSIDDSATTEIDDALSVTRTTDGTVRVGVHIAAPALALDDDKTLDSSARDRMSTVYMPGGKITMNPAALVEHFSLVAGVTVPTVSLYAELNTDGTGVDKFWCALERLSVTDNLRDDQLDAIVTEQALENPPESLPHGEALSTLWKLTHGLLAEREHVRGKPEPRFRTDFTFKIADDQVSITQRRRDAPLSRIVAEMMIMANSEWGGILAEQSVAGIYRSQQGGRVRMSTQSLPHEGLGVDQYIWATSPLRRYIDLVNQRQLVAVIEQAAPPFEENSADLFSIMPAFEARHSAYQDFQQRMERYWCIRWLEQQESRPRSAAVVRDDLVRLADAPLYFKAEAVPALAPGRRLTVDILETDRLDLSVRARFVELEETGEEASDSSTNTGEPGS